ncbi:MAG: hypothetical protein CK423_08110 [Legionella sp.]|nr:MAG: hypothetical protein CK423_08110 [Legionella sp.]
MVRCHHARADWPGYVVAVTETLQKATQGPGMPGGILIKLEDTIVTGKLGFRNVVTAVLQISGLSSAIL